MEQSYSKWRRKNYVDKEITNRDGSDRFCTCNKRDVCLWYEKYRNKRISLALTEETYRLAALSGKGMSFFSNDSPSTFRLLSWAKRIQRVFFKNSFKYYILFHQVWRGNARK